MSQGLHLRNGGVSVVVDTSGSGLPAFAYWGADLGELGDQGVRAVLDATAPAAIGQGPDVPVRPALLPEHASGWLGRPGLSGSRVDGSGWVPSFHLASVALTDADDSVQLTVRAVADAGLSLVSVVELTAQGLLRVWHTVTNDADSDYQLSGMVAALPVPVLAQELLDMAGRWARERSPQRRPFAVGCWSREARGGRTGPDSPTVLIAAAPGVSWRSGEAWGIHLAWSGNATWAAERLSSGDSVLSAGELLAPGEVVLGAHDSYTTPVLFGSWSDQGLDGLSARFHRWLRARPQHPSTSDRPRPVTLNVWEAVYFDQRLERLLALAKVARGLGVERYVLDDGWFRHRRNDHAGLGDWYVDETLWPQGLHPLVDAVRDLGMEFGLWFEPEMVNLDSDLARAHPDWILGASSGLPGDQRHQQVLDIGQSDAWDYVFGRIDAILTEYPITFVKWDHNRQLIAASTVGGRAGVHRQTLATYRMLAELRRRHPGLEIESCCGGGGRIDLGILEFTDRVWTSDCNDALDRQMIQRWTGLLLPPELMGAHVGPTRSHTTDRTHSLSFRCATALFGHFGIEWDITAISPDEQAELGRWIDLYRAKRNLIHTGTVVRADSPDPAYWLHGVVAEDHAEALYALVRLTTSVTAQVGTLRFPGLDPDSTYRVQVASPAPLPQRQERATLPWLSSAYVATGRVLGAVGLQAPALQPEHALVLEVTRL